MRFYSILDPPRLNAFDLDVYARQKLRGMTDAWHRIISDLLNIRAYIYAPFPCNAIDDRCIAYVYRYLYDFPSPRARAPRVRRVINSFNATERRLLQLHTMPDESQFQAPSKLTHVIRGCDRFYVWINSKIDSGLPRLAGNPKNFIPRTIYISFRRYFY